MDKLVCLGFAILELSKLHMYETYSDILQPYFGLENIQLHYMDCDSFVLSLKTENVFKELRNLEDVFDLSNLDENHELFSNQKTEKILVSFKLKLLKKLNRWFHCLRNKCYAFLCGDIVKMKWKLYLNLNRKMSNLKKINFVQKEKKMKMCDNYILKSINHEIYPQKIRKTSLSIIDDKRNYLDKTESLPWRLACFNMFFLYIYVR